MNAYNAGRGKRIRGVHFCHAHLAAYEKEMYLSIQDKVASVLPLCDMQYETERRCYDGKLKIKINKYY